MLIFLVTVHGQRQGAEFHGTAVRVCNIGRKILFPNGGYHVGKAGIQPDVIGFCQRGGGLFPVYPRLKAEFLCQDGGNSGETAVNGLKGRLGFCGHCVFESFVIGVQRVQLILCPGYEIISPGKHLAKGADRSGNMLDAVQNHSVFIAENNIAVFSHDFNYQGLLTQITHFVQMFYVDSDNAFQARLGNARNSPVLQMLAQEHTEIGRRYGAGLI